MFYINYEECKFIESIRNFIKKCPFYINYEECKFSKMGVDTMAKQVLY